MIQAELQGLATLARGAGMVAALLTLRLLPAALTMLASRRSTWRGRCVLAGCFSALAWAATGLDGVVAWFWLASSALYMLLVAGLVYGVGRMRAKGEVGLLECALIPIMGFIVVPSILVPADARTAVLVLGWDAALSSYSYCVEARRNPAGARGLGECLFFLLVNPTIVYVRRGRRVATGIAWHARGARRMALGAAVLLLANTLMMPLYASLDALAHANLGYRVLSAIAVFATQYAMHSGLASVQIGMLRQAGYELPERYNRPFLARSPVDFWRRWNTYVGCWVERYLFIPVAIRIGRLRIGRFRTNALAQALAVVFSFLAVGLMHDAYTLAANHVIQARATWLLTIGGTMTLAWAIAERSGVLRRVASRFGAASPWLVPLAGRAAFAGTILVMIAST